jgi:hypothetical protein
MSVVKLLIDALLGIYSRAGAEVTYITERGERRPYWANRYLQAVKRAIAEGDDAVIAFVERLVNQPEPSRGFFYLKDAGRLDLSVEALVVDTSRPFHQLFSGAAVAISEERLREHGWTPAKSADVDALSDDNASDVRGPAAITLGGRTLTLTANYWYLMAVSGLRGDQVQALDAEIVNCSKRHNAPVIGGNHVLEALLATDLYQRVWPGFEEAAA